MSKKRLLPVLICAVLLFANMTAFAKEDVTIMPCTMNITKAGSDLSINSSNVATIKCSLQGTPGVTKTTITATLQKKNGSTWTNVQTWSATSNSERVSLSKTKTVSKGGTYRVQATFKAIKGGITETTTKYSAVKTN